MNAFLRPMNAPSCPDDVSTLQYRDSTPYPHLLGESHLLWLAAPFLSPPTSAHTFQVPFHLSTISSLSLLPRRLFLSEKQKSFPFLHIQLKCSHLSSDRTVSCLKFLFVTTQAVPAGRAVSWPSLCHGPLRE